MQPCTLCRRLTVSREDRLYHRPNHSGRSASGRLALLPCGIVVEPSTDGLVGRSAAWLRVALAFWRWGVPAIHFLCTAACAAVDLLVKSASIMTIPGGGTIIVRINGGMLSFPKISAINPSAFLGQFCLSLFCARDAHPLSPGVSDYILHPCRCPTTSTALAAYSTRFAVWRLSIVSEPSAFRRLGC